jgi:hypothetical protein
MLLCFISFLFFSCGRNVVSHGQEDLRVDMSNELFEPYLVTKNYYMDQKVQEREAKMEVGLF